MQSNRKIDALAIQVERDQNPEDGRIAGLEQQDEVRVHNLKSKMEWPHLEEDQVGEEQEQWIAARIAENFPEIDTELHLLSYDVDQCNQRE